MINKIQKISIVTLSTLLLLGCVEPTVNMPQHSKIQKGHTDYSNALEYLDTMISVFNNGKPMVIVVDNIQNRTASRKVPADITDIIKTSFNKIGNHVITLFSYSKRTEKRKVFFINGAITEFDVIEAKNSNVNTAGQFGNQEYRTDIDGGIKDGSKITKLALNFNPADPQTGTYIPRTSTSNKITIYQKQSSNQFAFSILGSGFGFSNAVTKTQGLHSSITVLAEFSVAEVLGKLGKFPYWLLTNGKVNPDIKNYLSKTFLRNTMSQKIQKISYLLKLKAYPIQVTNVMTPALEKTIIEHKTKNNLPVNNFITKQLYLSLLEK
jgi:hypothetical protein